MSWFGYNRYSSYDQRKFTVYMNEGEKDQIEQWVKQYENIETGGDLFGAWIDDRTAVVQFVLGPGESCRRTSVSFFQDIDYLRNAGSYLTQKHGLCNIGQWHSHHRLSLTRPSGGDENTVWGNMPNLGLDRYIVIIATITDKSYWNREITVNINPYLFEIKNGYKNGVLDGSFDFLKQNSPFRVDKSIQRNVAIGAETTNDITTYPETERGNAGKRPHENESKKSAAKIPKTEAEDMSHRMTQSLAQNAEIFNKNEGGPLEVPAGDGTVRNLENVRNENEGNGHYIVSQGDSTEEYLEDVTRKEDEVCEQTNIGKSDDNKQNPEDVPNKVEESKQSNSSQDEDTKKNQNIWNEDEVRELSNIEQGGATDRTPEDVPRKKKGQNIWKKNEVEDEISDQSNIKQGETIEGNSEKDPTLEEESGQFNTAQGDGTEQTVKDVTIENEESDTSNIPQEESPNFWKKVSGQSNIEQEGGTENFFKGIPTEDAESRQSSTQRNGSESNVKAEVDSNKNSETTTSNEATEMMDVDDNQLSTSGKQEDIEEDPSYKCSKADNLHTNDDSQINNDAALNALLDSNDTSKHVTSKSPDENNEKENDAMEINNDKLSASDTQQHHEQGFLQNDPEGEVLTNHDDENNEVEDSQSGESNILQKDAESDLQQSLEEDSLTHLPIKQDFYNKTNDECIKADFEKDEDKAGKDDRELDGNLQETFQDDTTVKKFDKHCSNKDEVEYDTTLLDEVIADEQSKILQNDVGNNLDLEEHSNDTSKHAKSTSPGGNNEKQIDAMEINDQVSTSDTQQHHEQDFLQNDPEGEVLTNHDDTTKKNGVEDTQCGESDILQKDAESDWQQSLHEDSLTHLPIKQDFYNKTKEECIKADFEKNEDKAGKDDRELDAMDINDQVSTSDSQEQYKHDILQNDPDGEVLRNYDDGKKGVKDGQCVESDILRKDAKSDLKQNSHEDSLTQPLIKRDVYITKTDEERIEKDEEKTPKNDGELDGNLQEASQENTTLETFDKHRSDKGQVKSDTKHLGDVLGDKQQKIPHNDVDSNEETEERTKRDCRKVDDKNGGMLNGPNAVQSNLVDATHSLSSERTGGNRLHKNGSTRRSIFDPLETHEANTNVGKKSEESPFKENETKDEERNSQNNKQHLPDPQSSESSKTTQIGQTGSDNGTNNDIISENPNKNGTSSSEIEIGKDEAADSQTKMDPDEKLPKYQSTDDDKERAGCLPCKYSKCLKKKKSNGQNDNGGKEKQSQQIEGGEDGDIRSTGKKSKDVEVSGVNVAKKGDEKENSKGRIWGKKKERKDRKKKEKQ